MTQTWRSKFIGSAYRRVLKPILFMIEPEKVHDRFVAIGNFLGRFSATRAFTRLMFDYKNPKLAQTIFGLLFSNPVGLSAGFDKNASLIDIMGAVGFGAMEIGTVTARAYAGNMKPRLWRLPRSRSLVVNYGLRNIGARAVLERMRGAKTKDLVRGVSIGRTNLPDTAELEAGLRDFVDGFREVAASGLGDFYTLNISCPNTCGGESFTTPELLTRLLAEITAIPSTKPLLLKMPINLPWPQFEALLPIAIRFGVAGVIIGNLNKDRAASVLVETIPANVRGNLSGKATWQLSNELISKTYAAFGDRLTIVGCGGIFSAADAYEKIRRGASLLQMITGMIFEGPQLIGDINRGLVEFLQRDGFANIQEAVGSGHRKN